MGAIGILGIAVGLAMDAFSVAVAVGTAPVKPTLRHYFRISFHFGLFQFMMPIVGYFAGVSIEPIIRDYDHWVAMLLLMLVGVNMTRESFLGAESHSADPSRGITLVVLSVATSVDALVVGLSLGLLNAPILIASIVIGLVCALFSILGISLGKKAGAFLGRKMGLAGGFILIAIGAIIVLEHFY